jgi:hypothetical protein
MAAWRDGGALGCHLACSINMRGGTRGAYTPACHHVKILAVAFSSRPNFEALATLVVLEHPHVAFLPYTCGINGGTAAVAAALIGYDDVEVAVGMTMRRR